MKKDRMMNKKLIISMTLIVITMFVIYDSGVTEFSFRENLFSGVVGGLGVPGIILSGLFDFSIVNVDDVSAFPLIAVFLIVGFVVGATAGGIYSTGGKCNVNANYLDDGSVEKCAECGRDPLQPCTQYICASIGKNCIFSPFTNDQCFGGDGSVGRCVLLSGETERGVCKRVSDGAEVGPCVISGESGQCLYKPSDDFTPPRIRSCDVRDLPQKEPATNAVHSSTGCSVSDIREYQDIVVKLETDEPARCGFTMRPGESLFDDSIAHYMFITPFGGYELEHYLIIWPDTISSFPQLESDIQANCRVNEICTLYARCADFNDNPTTDYRIRFRLLEGEDISPPRIYPEVGSGARIEASASDKQFNMEVTDRSMPVSCKYIKVEDLLGHVPVDEAEIMANLPGYEGLSSATNFNCRWQTLQGREEFEDELGRYVCTTSLTGLRDGENWFYFSCIDNCKRLGTCSVPAIGNSGTTAFMFLKGEGLSVSTEQDGSSIVIGQDAIAYETNYQANCFVKYKRVTESSFIEDRSLNTIGREEGGVFRHSLSSSFLESKGAGAYTIRVECIDLDADQEASTEFDIKANFPGFDVTINNPLTGSTITAQEVLFNVRSGAEASCSLYEGS